MRVVVLVVLPCSTAMDAGSVAPVAVEGVAASSAMAAGSVAPTSSSAMVAGSAAPVAVPGATARTGGVTGVGSGTSAVPKKESHESKARSILGLPPIPQKRRKRPSSTVGATIGASEPSSAITASVVPAPVPKASVPATTAPAGVVPPGSESSTAAPGTAETAPDPHEYGSLYSKWDEAP